LVLPLSIIVDGIKMQGSNPLLLLTFKK